MPHAEVPDPALPPTDAPGDDPALEALTALVSVLEEESVALAAAVQRARRLQARRAEGRPYREIVPGEPAPLIVETISRSLARLSDAGGRWRREEARALHEEGLSMERIAALFGVTRQRVSALLAQAERGGPGRRRGAAEPGRG